MLMFVGEAEEENTVIIYDTVSMSLIKENVNELKDAKVRGISFEDNGKVFTSVTVLDSLDSWKCGCFKGVYSMVNGHSLFCNMGVLFLYVGLVSPCVCLASFRFRSNERVALKYIPHTGDNEYIFYYVINGEEVKITFTKDFEVIKAESCLFSRCYVGHDEREVC